MYHDVVDSSISTGTAIMHRVTMFAGHEREAGTDDFASYNGCDTHMYGDGA